MRTRPKPAYRLGAQQRPRPSPPACRIGDRVIEQEIVYEKLPRDIAERYVLFLDPMLGTGSSAARALQVLLDKGVEQSKILFLSLIAAPEGIHRICRDFPLLKLITSEIDEGTVDYRVVPGARRTPPPPLLAGLAFGWELERPRAAPGSCSLPAGAPQASASLETGISVSRPSSSWLCCEWH